MYESFFQLNVRPFAAAPRVDRYFPGKAIEASRLAIARAVERAEGPGLIIGPPGTGKTLLCHLLAEQFRGKFAVALLSNGHLDNRRELLQAILFELGLPYRRLEEGELRLSLIDYVSNEQASRGGLLLIIDEAHTLSPRLLEEVRLIANLVQHGQPRVRLVLAGNPALEETLADPGLAVLNQRISARCYLQPLDYNQSQQYVLAQLTAPSGETRQIFTTDALEAIYRTTDGVPRLINQLCDHVLMLAYAGGQQRISADGIEEAWADLQQLPSSGIVSVADERQWLPVSEDFIEFGSLDDEQYATSSVAPIVDEIEFEPAGHVGPAAEATLLIHQIDDHLNQLDRDFAGSAQSHSSQIPSRTPADPFGESFDEEEILIDRYTSLDVAAVDSRRQVESDDGRVLSKLLEPFDRFELPSLSVVGKSESTESDIPIESAETTPEWLEALADNSLGSFSASTSDSEQPNAVVQGLTAADDENSVSQLPAATVRLANSDEAISADDDLMIVEEDPHTEIRPHVPHRAAPVRRQEYRQLFSSMRRG